MHANSIASFNKASKLEGGVCVLIFIKRERGGVVLICLILIREVSSFVCCYKRVYVETCDFPVGLQPASFHKITKQEGKCPYVL